MAGQSPPRRSPRSSSSGERGVPDRVLPSPAPRAAPAVAGIATCSSGKTYRRSKTRSGACRIWGTAGCTASKNGGCSKSSRGGAGVGDAEASPVDATASAGGIVESSPAAAGNSPVTAKGLLGDASECDPMHVVSGGMKTAPWLAGSSGSPEMPREVIDLTAKDDGPVGDRRDTISNSPRQPFPAPRNRKRRVEGGPVRRSPRTVENSLKTENGSVRRSPRIVSCFLQSAANAASNEDSDDDGDDSRPRKKAKVSSHPKGEGKTGIRYDDVFFVGDPVPAEEARSRWPHHYVQGRRRNGRIISSKDDEDEIVLDVKCHYYQASIVGTILNLGDCAYIKAEEGKANYLGRVLEFFETIDGDYYFTVQWFFRAEDTVIKEQATLLDKRRIFYSDLRNDNLLDCIVSKVTVVEVSPRVDLKPKCIPACDFYYDMKYSVEYSSFYSMAPDDLGEKSELSSYDCFETLCSDGKKDRPVSKDMKKCESVKCQLALLDLYCGCGGMSTGLCLGAHDAGVDVVTRWAVDVNEAACKALKLNHPETQVRNESGDDFFALLKEWEILCKRYVVGCERKTRQSHMGIMEHEYHKKSYVLDLKIPDGEFEVSSLVDICYGDPCKTGKRGLKFKVRWKGYGPGDDTWEPIEGLSSCQDRIKEFVCKGFKSKILPLPGDVDVVCGGPPCQGISGLNRHRNVDAPLDDEKNRQIVVFMDIVKFLKPKYVLMENVVDILKFASGTLGRYALSRLVSMNYQARIGIMAAGCYGLPQFRLRVFFWGCHPCEKLPSFPLPTHDVIMKGGAPTEFERNVVAYDEGQPRMLVKALVLEDAISDLPAVTCHEVHNQMPYGKAPQTDFQRYIRATKCEIMGLASNLAKRTQHSVLYDHCPLQLAEENYLRICQIPKRKGACFRDLPGIAIQPDNTVQWDPTINRVLLPSGKPLVPDFVIKFENGKSIRPYARLWWDEIVPTVLTNADPHYQVITHPEQDRVLTVRENARLQGFPDYYRFYGTIKERYCQIGNAVALPVGRALGYTLGMSWLKQSGKEALMTLPPKFSHFHIPHHQPSSSSEVQD
uniref:DNA (cytosine-5-)-methyltransferase n=1 Tax=Anthurium amnicola TaxID=1678845 RepID=A0A1D1YKA9_9ARAE